MKMPPVQPASLDSPGDDFEDLPSENVDHPIVVSDTESDDDENGGHEGYELLSQDPDNCVNEMDSEEDDSNFISQNGANCEQTVYDVQNLLLPAPSDEIICDDDFESNKDVHMDDEHIEKIKNLMKGIHLPSSNLPHWANSIPEDEWKAQLLMQMSARKFRENDSIGVPISSSTCEMKSYEFVEN